MRIRLLGTGTPTPSLTRMGAGHMVEIGDDVILFDHGPGAYHRMIEAGVEPTQVTHLFLTHLHYDHCVDYPRWKAPRSSRREPKSTLTTTPTSSYPCPDNREASR